MRDITKKEMELALKILKSPETDFNANSLAKVLNISAMGALKILKRLEKDAVLKSKKIGKAVIYRINHDSQYAQKYLSLIISRESVQAAPQVKRWIFELNKIKNADLIILFGSVLNKSNPNDIDALFVTDQKGYKRLTAEVKEINELSLKKIHPMYQSKKDMVNNIKKRDGPLLSAIKGIIIKGEELFINIYHESRQE